MLIGEKRGIFMFRNKKFKKRYISFGILAFATAIIALVFAFSGKPVDTESYGKKSDSKVVKKVTKSSQSSTSTSTSKEETSTTEQAVEPSTSTETSQVAQQAVAETTTQVSTPVATQQAPSQVVPVATQAPVQQAAAPTYLANGNTAGVVGTSAAAQMAAATGVPQSTWEAIIARESNGDPYVSNPSGASGLFQTMPGWGSTATVQDQINSAISAYNAQGLSAWGY